MDENRALMERLRDATTSGDLSQLSRLMDESATDDFVQEWPQSGERIRGKEAFAKINDSYSGETGSNPKATFRRLTGEGNTYVLEGTIDYGDGTPVSYVSIAELENGKVRRLTEYFANPFEAPEWRRGMVERMEPSGA